MRCGWPRTKPHVSSAVARAWAPCWVASKTKKSRRSPTTAALRDSHFNLSMIYAMENDHRDAREMVARVLEEKEFVSVRPETLVSLVHESGALDRARNLAQDYALRAKACLNGGPDSEYHRALVTLPDFILEREN